MSDKQEPIIVREKWADKVTITGYTDAKIIHGLNMTATQIGLPEAIKIGDIELKKTDEEMELIREANASMNYLRHLLGLDPISLSLDRFHVIGPADWKDRLDILGSEEGLSALGHCYLIRSERKRFVVHLTHEISHVGGYLAIEIISDPDVTHELTVRRYGMGRVHRDESKKHDYLGLMEAATEIVASNIKKAMADSSKILTDKECNWVLKHKTYQATTLLIEELIIDIANKVSLPARELSMILLRDHFLGTSEFLKVMRRHKPKAIHVFRTMGDTPKDALEAAKALSLNTTVQAIDKAIKASKKAK